MEEYYVIPNQPSDIDMFGTTLEDMLNDFQSDTADQASGRSHPSTLAGYVADMIVIAEEFTRVAQGFERQFEREFGMVISQ